MKVGWKTSSGPFSENVKVLKLGKNYPAKLNNRHRNKVGGDTVKEAYMV